MGVTAGYKQSELGLIPQEWELKRLGDLASVSAGGTPSRAIAQYWNGEIPWVTTSEVDFYTIAHAEQSISKEGLNNSAAKLLPPGTILMALYGQGKTRGKIGILGIEAATNQACAAISLERSVLPEFIFHFLASQYESIRRLSNTGNQENLNGTLVRSIWILLPPSHEQRAIAAALSDVDALLGSLDRLIAKKRDLKQAALQQLLTGQTRLPSFHGDWEETTFGSVVRHHSGNSALIKGKLSSSDLSGLFPAYSASGQDVWCDHYEYEGHAIVVSAVGSRCGKAFKASGKWCAIANTHVVWPDPKKIDSRLLGYFINDEDFWQKSGTGQPFVLFKKTFARPLRLPPLPEQTAIADVLGETDAELASLDQRRDKTRALKHAMMQELLTGKTRLV